MTFLTLKISPNMEVSEGITQHKSNVYDSSNTKNFSQYGSEGGYYTTKEVTSTTVLITHKISPDLEVSEDIT